MRAKIIDDVAPRTWALVFDTGDDVVGPLTEFATLHQLTAARFTAIGAFSEATLGYFDWERKDYDRIPIDEQVEVLSLVGDVALDGGQPRIHAHVVVGKHDGTAHGGHLLAARVRPTLEVMLVESPARLARVFDPITGLALIEIDPAHVQR
jgi:predicted DNA-binding protein with PD1-like motif